MERIQNTMKCACSLIPLTFGSKDVITDGQRGAGGAGTEVSAVSTCGSLIQNESWYRKDKES